MTSGVLMCGQDVTMIEPRLVIWNHLETISTKVFFYNLIFFFPVVSYVKKKKKKEAGLLLGNLIPF